VKARLGDTSNLQSVADTTASLQALITSQMRGFIAQAKDTHTREFQPLLREKSELVNHHRTERHALSQQQEARWKSETKDRLNRLNSGLRGIWDRITGARSLTLRENEKEALACSRRDQVQRDCLISAQLHERHKLQRQIERLKAKHARERRILARDVGSVLRQKRRLGSPSQAMQKDRSLRHMNVSRRRDPGLSL